ncbi:Predicted ester cyclase [Halogranum amylolyticum]|uniref:Predicted ester cyclase n=1 Tax=Halogranum amylolyticum TaxID=660520 RepID=A0A1H8WTN5_9EURY|nr:ester cyclase [Halogranum amylolyticum]SEP30986.1 Predicted ester cyclase [Halogranum amylolyticum]
MSSTTLEDRKEIVREAVLSEWNTGEVDDDTYTSEYVMHDPLGDHDLAGVKDMVKAVRAGTSDLEIQVHDLIGEGDRVVLRYTMGGTNTGPSLLTEEPTGKSWEGSGISIYRTEDGKIAEQWDSFDYLSVMQQLGLLPSEPTE